MAIKNKPDFIFKFLTIGLCLGWLLAMRSLNEVPLDVGDGLMHFNIAQASWTHPALFLDHWGKPMFILLSSTFAQFGLDGVVLFNILVFLITILFAWKILSHFKIPTALQCLFPVLLLNIFDYSNNILGGLTEPLFSMTVMIATWLIIKKQWLWFALLVSFMPFMRSEGQLAIVLGFALLLFQRQYKSIPLLLFGFMVYSTIGNFAVNDFWWYFTQSPYKMENDIYGHGTWDHYLISYKMYLGNPGLIVFIIGSLRLIYLVVKKQWQEIQFPWLFFTYGLFFGILVSHSYFWAMGLNGSFGLTRIITQAMPSFVLINLYYIGKVDYLPSAKFLVSFATVVVLFFVGKSTLKSPHFPRIPDPLDRQVINTANFLKAEKGKGHHFFFHHPLFVLKMGENPKIGNQECVFYYCPGLKQDLGVNIKPGDYLIRDSHFGPLDAKLPLSEFDSVPEMVKVKEFVSEVQTDDPFHEVEGVTVYQYVPKKK